MQPEPSPSDADEYPTPNDVAPIGTGMRDESTIRWLHDIKDELLIMNNYLEGKTPLPNEDGEIIWVLPENKIPRLNEHGRAAVLSGIHNIGNKIFAMGNVTPQIANNLFEETMHAMEYDLCVNHKLYALAPNNFTLIVSHYRSFVLSAISRTINAGNRNSVLHQISEMIHGIADTQDKKGGLKDWGR